MVAVVHAQPADAVMFTVAVPPGAGMVSVEGATVYEHPDAGGMVGGAPWATVYTWPATTTVPVRGSPTLGATSSVTAPAPSPDAPESTRIQATWLMAVHPHPDSPDTFTLRLPPSGPTVPIALSNLNSHAAGLHDLGARVVHDHTATPDRRLRLGETA